MLLLLRSNPDSILSESSLYLTTEDNQNVLIVDNTPIAAAYGSIKIWTGSSWKVCPAKVWTGTAWVIKPVKIWNGSSWITTNY